MALTVVLRVFALLLLVVASHQLYEAIDQALRDGTVMLSDTRPRRSGQRRLEFPVPWREAWSYLLGWFLAGAASLRLLARRSLSGGGVFSYFACLFLSFILVAAATMFGSFRGVVTWLAVFLSAVAVAVAFALWKSARDHHKLSLQPDQDDAAG